MNEMSTFVVCRIMHCLLNLVLQFQDVSNICLLMASLSYLDHFLSLILPARAAIIDTLLHHIVTTVVLLNTHANKDVRDKAFEIVNCLVVRHCEVLPSVAKLDPLPDNKQFENISIIYNKLRKEANADMFKMPSVLACDIKHFVTAGEHQLNQSCRLEGLRYLNTQLCTKKHELAELYTMLRASRGFVSDCTESILHQLICMLVDLTSSADVSVAMEAARCLGELGPADLSTLVLQGEKDQFEGTLEALANQMAETLSNLLLDSHVQVTQAASKSLYLFVNTKSGFKAAGNLPGLKQKLLYPFMKICNKLIEDILVHSNSVKTVELAAAFKMMCPNEPMSHNTWVTELAKALLEPFPESSYLYQLIPICLAKVSFAEDIILYITHLVFLSSSHNHGEDLCLLSITENVNKFLLLHFESNVNNSNSEPDVVSDVYYNRASVRIILNVASAIYLYVSQDDETWSSRNDFTNLNYLHVAKAAQFCSAFFTSVFYAELWFYSNYSEHDDLNYLFQSGSNRLEYVAEKSFEDGVMLQNLLYEAYKRIGEPDAVYGCTPTQLLDPSTRLQHYELEGSWNRVMETHDLELSKGININPAGLGLAIRSAGLYHLAGVYATSVPTNNSILSEIQHECAWRLSKWSLPDCKSSFQGLTYSALKAVSLSDKNAVFNNVSEARNLVITSLKHTSLESAHSIYKFLSQLQCLEEIEDFAQMDLQSILLKWKLQDEIGWINFESIEPVFAQRIVLTGIKGGEEHIQVCIRGTQAALSESHYSEAARNLHRANDTLHLNRVTQLKIKLEQAKFFWARRDTNIGRQVLRSLMTDLKDTKSADLKNLHSSALRIYGTWMAETRSENAEQIVNKYLQPAYELVSHSDDQKTRIAAMNSLARFTDLEYQALSQYIKSADFQCMIKKANIAGEKLEMLGSSKTKLTKDQCRAQAIFKNFSVIDEKEIANTRKSQEYYLLLALRYYLKCLIEGGEEDDVCVFRIISLWLENKNHSDVNDLFSEHLGSVPTYKFLIVLPQLAAHITDGNDEFSVFLHSIFERCAVDHPYHTLPLILALSHSYKDNESTQETKKLKEESRVSGSTAILKKLCKNSKISQVVKNMIKLSEAYIQLANLPSKEKKELAYKLSKNDLLMKLGALPQVLITTLTIPYRKSTDYSDIIGIHSFQNYYELVGGVNAPKKISCVGTDGIKRILLVKGKDDLRQDAVMMQVFTILNSLLQKNKRTNQRKLVIRTYKVVPMSQRSGVIEWCSNTIELASYLVGKNGKGGAHHKYRPSDQVGLKCRQLMASAAGTSKEHKFEVFNRVCEVIHPVMHHYFYESYKTPGAWFEKRLAYTHSVACASMVGYILGIGDRHVTNILIDKETAELIHIDFGIAFEMGKCLPTPETVPFRLTRDIVDGMGVSGVEGVFRRCCEETMIVLRDSQETLMTILEVLLYDPLYTWTVLPQKTVDQQMKSFNTSSATDSSKDTEVIESTEVNDWAERALLRLKQKLQGVDQGSSGPPSIEGQVEWLIQEAMDRANLCCLFNGWQAFL